MAIKLISRFSFLFLVSQGIESTILTSEQAHLLALRAKQQEAETKAAAMRAAAEKKAAEETRLAEELKVRKEAAAARAQEEVERERLEKEATAAKEKGGALGGLEEKAKVFGEQVEVMRVSFEWCI